MIILRFVVLQSETELRTFTALDPRERVVVARLLRPGIVNRELRIILVVFGDFLDRRGQTVLQEASEDTAW